MRAQWLTLAVFIGCAPTRPEALPSPSQQPASITETGTGAEIRLANSRPAVEMRIGADARSVWSAAAAVYEAMNITVEAADPRGLAIQSKQVRARRRFANEQMSALMDCGSTITGRRADLWQVTLQLLTVVRADGPTDSTIATRVTATARPVDGSSTDAVPCLSNGLLEKKIAEVVRVRVGA
jgi:hypothetical protein